MEMLNLSLPATNRFASQYLEQSADIQPFFHYRYNLNNDDHARLAELTERHFPRKELANHIAQFMEKFPASQQVQDSLEKLKRPESAVVIGGQQAGILTGPLYTIHKLISIIKLAQQKEKELNIPVVPVFWIAGEDHDYHEVNHVYIPIKGRAEKWVYPEKMLEKKMVSAISLNKETCFSWVKRVIECFGETSFTNQLLSFTEDAIEKSDTFVDFFAMIIMELFKDYGLLIVDSGNPDLRLLEKEILKKQIQRHEEINDALLTQQKIVENADFECTIEGKANGANIFYYDERFNERILLEFDPEKQEFIGKNGAISFSKEELLEIADLSPHRLSNNVVTRPLTQELLFPTLAFIAGPGEIAYWAELKLVFEKFGIKLPPIVPRLNITLLERSVETSVQELSCDLAFVLKNGTKPYQDELLTEVKDTEVYGYFSAAKNLLNEQYQLIHGKLEHSDRGLLPLLIKNQDLLNKQIGFMEKKVEDADRERHRVIFNKYEQIDLALKPSGSPQERMWNVFYYLNGHGFELIKSLLELTYEFDGTHKVIKL